MTFSYDFQETEEYGDFVTLTPGRYIFALTKVKKDVSAAGNPKAVVTLTVVAGNSAYIGGIINQHWPVTGKGAFRFRAMLKALGVNVKDRGKVALEKYIDDEFGARVTLQEGKEKNEAGETVWFHELNAILSPAQYADLLEEAEEDEEWEDGEEETEEAEEEKVEEDEDEEDEGVSVEDLDEMSLAELKELAEDWEISTKPDKGKKKLTMAQMRRRLTVFIEEAEDEGEDEDEDEDEDEEEEEGEDVLTVDDLDNMDLAELREVAKDNEVKLRKPPKGKKQTAARVRKTLVEALFADEDEGDDEEPF